MTKTTTMRTLLAEAGRYGARVILAKLPEGLRAHYDERRHEILVNISLTMPEIKEALAHELGHARYCHTCTDDHTEARAWRIASRLLIDVDDYREAELIDSDPQAIADELGVTRRIVRIFQREWLPSLSLQRGA